MLSAGSRNLATAAAAVLLLSCGGESTPRAGDSAAPTKTVGMPIDSATTAPNEFRVLFETSKGPFVVEVHRDWAPRGADRFYHMVQSQYFDNVRFFRVVSSFMAQFGMHGDPRVNAAWEKSPLQDDSVRESNRRGYLTFAMRSDPNSRTNQLFINIVNNRSLDEMGFAPIGRVVEGLAVIDSLYADYGDAYPNGNGPDQTRIRSEGNAYLEKDYPRLDFIRSARVVTDSSAAASTRDTSAPKR
jgi:peptidyl-prolyl cis-trans isomerase A (cyclophilin A)